MRSTLTKAALVITSGPSSGRTYELAAEETLLGRVGPCGIVLPSAGVSRRHVRITNRESGYFIEDLGSLNGTYVNEQRLTEPQLLKHDDRIQIHDTLLTFVAPTLAESEPAIDSDQDKNSSVVTALDVGIGAQSRIEVNPEIKLRAILEIIRSAGEARDIDQALNDVLDHVFQIFPQADHGFVLLQEPGHEQLVPRAIKHRQSDAVERTEGPISARIARQAMNSGQAILSTDATGGPSGDVNETIFDVQMRAIMCAPLIAPAEAKLGVLQLVTDDPQRQFAQPDLDVLASIGLLVGQLVEYARRYERKGAEGARRRSESRFQALVEKSWDSIAVLDAQGDVVYSTPGMTQQLGYPLGEGLGHQAFERLHPEDRATVAALFAELLTEPNGYRRAEFRVQAADGSWRWLESTATNLLHDPDVRGIVCNYHDITTRKQAEEQRLQLLEEERNARAEAERISRMKDEFLATLSHELRTPLNAIVGWADLLQMGKLDGPEIAQGIETIQRNARMQTRIIEDLLDMSRIISGRIRLEIQPVDVVRVVLAAIETVQPAAQAKEIRFEVNCRDCPPVNGDPARLQQVLWNLATNAIKFSPPKGSVAVSAAARGDQVEILVTDSGEGIEPGFLPHVFERFRQADSTPTRRHGGLGLGLAIVKQLVESHGGSVRAESAGRGHGSTFVVRLPQAGAQPASAKANSAAAAQDAGPDHGLQEVDILVVDDERDSRELARRILIEAGARVRCAASAPEALELWKQSPPDVLLADIAMPGMDGYELLSRIRALPPEQGGAVPAVAATAFAHADGRRRSYAAGFQFHLSKPLDRAKLLEVVARLANANQRS